MRVREFMSVTGNVCVFPSDTMRLCVVKRQQIVKEHISHGIKTLHTPRIGLMRYSISLLVCYCNTRMLFMLHIIHTDVRDTSGKSPAFVYQIYTPFLQC